jgi:hypothetical protein
MFPNTGSSPTMLAQLAQELGQYQVVAGQRHTTPAGTPVGPYMHGPNGLWSMTGVERNIISTRVQPRGLAGAIPARGSLTLNPLFPYLTGFLQGSGTNPTGVCDDFPVAGPMKNCLQTADFGRYGRMTREIDITWPGRTINRGELMDLNVVNDPLLAPDFNGNGILQPNVGPASLNQELLMRFVEVGIEFQNLLARQLYTGNPANNTSGGGYKEFPGLDLLIGTNKKDALTGTACPSLNSLIMDYQYRMTNDTSSFGDIVRVLSYMYRMMKTNASNMNLDPSTWAIVMRESMFYELTAVWPCSYMTYGCGARDTTFNSLNLDAGDMVQMRDTLRNGQYLLIDGQQVPVILDDAIFENSSTTTNRLTAGKFASDIYIIPLSVKGMAGVYWEFVDYQQTAMQTAAQGNISQYYWTDGGRYLWHAKPPKNFCAQYVAIIEPRIIFPFPHLAAKLRNVAYQPLIHTRDPFPTDSYFVNGGVTSRLTAPSLFADYKG